MYQNSVDVIGAESICKLIKQTKLTKFIIFRGGSQRGSTPVFRQTEARNIEQGINAFKDWAESVLRMNPYNNLPYDLLLFSAKTDDKTIDSAVKRRKKAKDADDPDFEDDLEASTTKKDRIRFTFSLNAFNNVSQMNGAGAGVSADQISTAIAEAFKQRDADDEVRRLRQEVADLKNRSMDEANGDDDDEDEGSGLDKVYKVMKEINKSALIKKGKYAEAAGDDDDDDDDLDDDDDIEDPDADEMDDDEEEETQPETKNKKPAGISPDKLKKLQRIKKALRILSKHDSNLDTDLMQLAKFAQKNTKMFSNYMNTLRNMNFD